MGGKTTVLFERVRWFSKYANRQGAKSAKSPVNTLLVLLALPYTRNLQQITTRARSVSELLLDFLATFFTTINRVLRPIEPPCSLNRTWPSQAPVLVAHEAVDSQ